MLGGPVWQLAKWAALAAVLAAGGGWTLRHAVVRTIPPHLLHNPHVTVPELFGPETTEELLTLAKKMRVFPTNVADLRFYSTANEHIGEAVDAEPDGSCSHPFLVPNSARTQCVLPGRIDIGKHYILSGGVEGLKESYGSLVSRVQSFGAYLFDLDQYPQVQALFGSEKFQQAARAVCPPDKQVLDPFQFNFIINVPGQTVAVHVDGAYFWGANRFYFPQWLLAVMVFSGIFEDRFIDQVQVVGYFHSWQATSERAGEFVIWHNSSALPSATAPHPGSGSAVDGSKTVHASSVYFPSAAFEQHPPGSPGRGLPAIDKSKGAELRYVGSDQWELFTAAGSNTEQTPAARYHTDDLRFSIVYRGRCFASEEDIAKHAAQRPEEMLKLEGILTDLVADLVRRGRVANETTDVLLKNEPEARYALATRLMHEYLTYPLSGAALVPVNYCAVGALVPWLSSALDPACSTSIA